VRFLVCYAAAQITLQLHQERIQVVHSNGAVHRIPAQRHWTHSPNFLVLLLCHHTASPPSKAGTVTGGVQFSDTKKLVFQGPSNFVLDGRFAGSDNLFPGSDVLFFWDQKSFFRVGFLFCRIGGHFSGSDVFSLIRLFSHPILENQKNILKKSTRTLAYCEWNANSN